MTKTPFSGTMERATDLLEIIHTMYAIQWVLLLVASIVIFWPSRNDLSRYGYIYLMKHKSETFEKFKEFQSEVEYHRNKKIKFLRSDRGWEYLCYKFGIHLKQCIIVLQLTPPGTRRSTRVRSALEWYGNPILEVMLLDHDEPTNYEEAMMSPDSAKMGWGHEIWDEIHVWEQSMDFDWLAQWSASHWD